MVQRSNNNEFSFDTDELPLYNTKKVFTGHVTASRKEAEQIALQLRLQGRVAHVQNGLEGRYEVVAYERDSEVRELTADYKEIGAGIWQSTNPDWDTGSLWTLYSSGPDGILISRIDEEDSEELTSDLMIESSIEGLARAASLMHEVGEVLAYVDPEGNIVEGCITEIDHDAGGYWVRNAITLNPDFIPLHTAETTDNGMEDDMDDELTVQGAFDDEDDEDDLEYEAELDDEMDMGVEAEADPFSEFSNLSDNGLWENAQDDDLTLQAADDDEADELDTFYELDNLNEETDDYLDDLIDDHEDFV